ncbi:PstS family phosphate ABC transporter substrate-binding protein [Halosolutus gelatinilyticus]|uniref:PstS family phosphate ABC transporter substrate-binding protein n=1 Tax=Halosolutus gelatinilyticus TaxID=2931975 RepID=UPI001FF615B2|nr:PstS family phosphate ABC transporter substrate-binding protein [Halosolutus gelatinilyticus]
MTDNQFGRSVGTVSRRTFLATSGALGTVAIAGCSETDANNNESEGDGSGGSELSGEVRITGSSTVYPISNQMAERFMDENPEVNVTVDSTGSGGGFQNHFCPGDSDINGASRPIKEEEESQCSDNGVTPIEMQVAGDALTMAVSNDNDWVDCMSYDELTQIWKRDGAEMWSDVNSDWPDEPFDLYGPDTTSGTYDWFTENVSDGTHTADHEGTEDDNIIIEALQQNPYAMGYFGYAYYAENESSVKALEIKKEEGGDCVAPSLQAASNGDYPMARPLFIYPSEEALEREEVQAFVEFYIENTSKDWIADEVGYVPANDDLVQENLDKI